MTQVSLTKKRSWLWRALIWLAIGLTGFLLLIGLLGALAQSFIGQEHKLLSLLERTSSIRDIGAIAQCLAALLIIWCWPAVVRWLQARHIVQGFEYDAVLASRRKVAAFATLYLVLIPIGLDRIWRWVTALIAA